MALRVALICFENLLVALLVALMDFEIPLMVRCGSPTPCSWR